jgi:hypothetical protein
MRVPTCFILIPHFGLPQAEQFRERKRVGRTREAGRGSDGAVISGANGALVSTTYRPTWPTSDDVSMWRVDVQREATQLGAFRRYVVSNGLRA